MNEYLIKLQKDIADDLLHAAMSYLKIGMEFLHEARIRKRETQPAIGNLGIAIELFLKAFLANKNLSLVFPGLPKDLQTFLTCSDELTSFNWRPYDIDLRTFKYKTSELDECIAGFNLFFPKEKQNLYAYFRLLSVTRNLSVHAAIPSFQLRPDLDRTGLLALKLYSVLKVSGVFGSDVYNLSTNDQQFLSKYDEEQLRRVHDRIEKAKEKSKGLMHGQLSDAEFDGWELFNAPCPICQSDALLSGYTDLEMDHDGDPALSFYAADFECGKCGLKLDDTAELRLASIDTVYDRNDQMDLWQEDQDPNQYFDDVRD